MKFAVVISRYYQTVAEGMLSGAREYLGEKGIEIDGRDIIDAPGSFEIPLIAQALAKTGRYAGVICIGCVVKGDTAHFEFISGGATLGVMQAMLQTSTPIAFGILTTYTEEQAEERAKPGADNKGREAAAACYESARILKQISGKNSV